MENVKFFPAEKSRTWFMTKARKRGQQLNRCSLLYLRLIYRQIRRLIVFPPFWKIGATDFNKVLCTPVSEPVNNRTSFHHSFFHLIEKPPLFFFLVSSPLIFDIFRFNPLDIINRWILLSRWTPQVLSLDFNVFDFKYNSNSNKSIDSFVRYIYCKIL